MALKGRVQIRLPATLQGAGGLKATKEDGIWTFEPDWSTLDELTVLPEPESKDLWVLDPTTNVYYRLSVQALIDSLPEGPAGADGALIYVQASAPPTDGPDGSLWIDSDSVDLDLYQLVSGAWFDTTTNLKGLTGPAAWGVPAAWVTATAYTVGPPASVVIQSGETYVCIVSHTSGTFATDLAGGKWIKVAAKGADGAGTGDVTAASNFGTDNRLIRSDGTTKGVQASGITIDDSNNVSGMATNTLPNTGLKLLDTDASHSLIVKPGSNLTADRTLTVTTGDADRTVTVNGNVTLPAGTVPVNSQVIQRCGLIAAPSNKDYRLILDTKYGFTINEVTTRSASGTCTATFKINTTALGGTANSVSSTETTQSHSSSNVVATGDDVVVTISSNSSCVDMAFTIKGTRTLA